MTAPNSTPAKQLPELRKEVRELRKELERLRAEAGGKKESA